MDIISILDNNNSSSLISLDQSPVLLDPHVKKLQDEVNELKKTIFSLKEFMDHSKFEMKKNDNDQLKNEVNIVIIHFSHLATAEDDLQPKGLLGTKKGPYCIGIVVVLDVCFIALGIIGFVGDAIHDVNKSKATVKPGAHKPLDPWLFVKIIFGALALIFAVLTAVVAIWYKKKKNTFQKLNKTNETERNQLHKLYPFFLSLRVFAEKKDKESIKACIENFYHIDQEARQKLLPALEPFVVTTINLLPEKDPARELLVAINKLARMKLRESKKKQTKKIENNKKIVSLHNMDKILQKSKKEETITDCFKKLEVELELNRDDIKEIRLGHKLISKDEEITAMNEENTDSILDSVSCEDDNDRESIVDIDDN